MANINLYDWGLTKDIYNEYKGKYGDLHLGRVVEEHKSLYKIITENNKILGKISGKLIYEATKSTDYPAVGDWVVVDRADDKNGTAIIENILTRKSKFSRKVAGKRNDEQIIATNIDTIFICMSFNNDFNINRLERYISLAWNSGAQPVILMTKWDLAEDGDSKLSLVNQVAVGLDVIAVSTYSKIGLDDVKKYVRYGKTVGFVGSSGVGKSTLINYLVGEEKQETQGLRNDDKGRHTTTFREVLVVPGGGVVIDTPGMREIHLLDEMKGIDNSFEDIQRLSNYCRFSDCTHTSEPGCAVKKAIEEGELTEKRLKNYVKLKKEAEYMERKTNKRAEVEYKKKLAKRGKMRKKIKYK